MRPPSLLGEKPPCGASVKSRHSSETMNRLPAPRAFFYSIIAGPDTRGQTFNTGDIFPWEAVRNVVTTALLPCCELTHQSSRASLATGLPSRRGKQRHWSTIVYEMAAVNLCQYMTPTQISSIYRRSTILSFAASHALQALRVVVDRSDG